MFCLFCISLLAKKPSFLLLGPPRLAIDYLTGHLLRETLQVISGSIPENLLETKTSPENGLTVLSSSKLCQKPKAAVTWARVPWGDGSQEKPVF